MSKAVKLWRLSSYWTDRAKGAIAHTKYKELPAVRARRIKTIEAAKRKEQKSRDRLAKLLSSGSGPPSSRRWLRACGPGCRSSRRP
jgi:hypothetical protein